MESITLYYREGSSDKVYQAGIHPQGDGFVVSFAYGRRGSSLTTGTKTPNPVDPARARAVYDKLVKEKMAKGYTPAESGMPYQCSEKAGKATGILPQLLNPIDETEALRLLTDPNWIMQEKFDGRRLLLRKTSSGTEGINRSGLIVNVPAELAQAVEALHGSFIVDGELLGDRFVAFDLLESEGTDLRSLPCHERLLHLHDLLGDSAGWLGMAESATTPPAKQLLYQRLLAGQAEGVVFKQHSSSYQSGRPNAGGNALKRKFYETASFIVGGVNEQRSVSLTLLEAGRDHPAGNVTIPPNHTIPNPGSVVEVRYLYAFRESGCVYQPVYLGQRDDMGHESCTLHQLKFKAPIAA